jgi:hypothetical protein
MPYVLKPNKLFVKNPDGDGFLPQNIVTDQATDDAVADIEAAGQAAVDRVNTAVSNAQSDMADLESQEATIASAIASMAELGTDTTLTVSGMAADAKATGDRISQLKSALSDLEDDLEEVYTGIPVIVTDTVNKLNVETLSLNTNITTTGEEVARNNTDASAFIPVVSGKAYVAFTGKNVAGTARVSLPIERLLFYNGSKSVISYKDNTSSNTIHEIPANTAYIRICVAHNDYITSRQPMVEFVNALNEISSTYVAYEEITGYSHGINYLDETQQDILERLGDVEDAVSPLASQVETNTGDIAALQSNVSDILGEAKAISALGTFARGGINSSTGAYDSYYQYRVATPNTITVPKDYTISIASGFRLYVATFVNGSLSDKGWKTEGYTLADDAVVRLMVARTTEDSSEIADVDTFCSKVTISAVASMNG